MEKGNITLDAREAMCSADNKNMNKLYAMVRQMPVNFEEKDHTKNQI